MASLSLLRVIEHIWPGTTKLNNGEFEAFLKSHQNDWDDIYCYDEQYKLLTGKKLKAIYCHTGGPTEVMKKHAALYGLRWNGDKITN